MATVATPPSSSAFIRKSHPVDERLNSLGFQVRKGKHHNLVEVDGCHGSFGIIGDSWETEKTFNIPRDEAEYDLPASACVDGFNIVGNPAVLTTLNLPALQSLQFYLGRHFESEDQRLATEGLQVNNSSLEFQIANLSNQDLTIVLPADGSQAVYADSLLLKQGHIGSYKILLANGNILGGDGYLFWKTQDIDAPQGLHPQELAASTANIADDTVLPYTQVLLGPFPEDYRIRRISGISQSAIPVDQNVNLVFNSILNGVSSQIGVVGLAGAAAGTPVTIENIGLTLQTLPAGAFIRVDVDGTSAAFSNGAGTVFLSKI